MARGIRHPWYRCQSLAVAAMAVPDGKLRLALVDEALAAAHELEEPNRVVTVASWPVEVLATFGPTSRLEREIGRLLTVAASEPHAVRRADALAMLLARAWANDAQRTRVLDALLATCSNARGWKLDWLLGGIVAQLATVDPRRAEEVVAMIHGAKAQRRARRDLDAALASTSG
jgi:hypothetical protein